MGEPETNIHVLDAAYKPFPTFEEWASRTSVDTVRWDRYNATLNDRSKLSPDILKRALEAVKRFAALDTGAIEGLYEVDRGFTYTVAFELSAWEVGLAEKGEHVRPLFEAQLHAYDYVLSLATKAEPISEAAIRVLHEEVCKAQATYRVLTSIGYQEQSLPKGRYKILPNHVIHSRDGTHHSYAPVDATPVEMARLVAELRSEQFLNAHPVLQAAYAHYALVVIHPFADGNGRVARALASAFTYRAISMPIVILSEQKDAYLDALVEADRGDFQLFVNFILDRSLDTISLVEEGFRGALVPTPEDAAAAIAGLFVTKGGYTQAQVDGAGERLFQLVDGELSKIIAKNVGSNLQGRATTVVMRGHKLVPDPAHRFPSSENGDLKVLNVELSSSPPAFARVFQQFALWLPKDAAGDDDVQLVLVGHGDHISGMASDGELTFSARMDELVPSTSGVLRIRVRLFADRTIGEMLSGLKIRAEKALKG